MVSAQVLRKQDHLEAGKKKLEEFRRKKAAEKAKKVASTNQTQYFDGAQNVKQVSISDSVPINNSDRVATSNAHAESSPILLKKGSIKLDGFENATDRFISRSDVDGSSGLVSASGRDNFVSLNQSSNPESHASTFSRYNGPESNSSKDTDGILKGVSSGLSVVSTSDDLRWNSFTTPGENDPGSIRNDDEKLMASSFPESVHFTSSMNHSSSVPEEKNSAFSDVGRKKSSGAIDDIILANHSSPWASNNGFSNFISEARNSSNFAFASPPMAGRKSLPSFLDHVQASKTLSPPLLNVGIEKAHESGFKVSLVDDDLGSSVSKMSAKSSLSNGDVPALFNFDKITDGDIFLRRQNEDFAALEQHIEDLTQEKFSLQRTLEASRALSDSLASENSTLTESFNQQGSVVNQLKLELEKLQGEIRFHMEDLRSLKEAYGNVQMECSAAEERAKLLASEVIELEEKALRFRSNELKAERQLENSEAEISSYRKKNSSLEIEREDLVSTIKAIQAEKKLLLTKLRNAFSSAKSVDSDKPVISKKDVATLTENLDSEHFQDAGSHESGNPSLEGVPIEHRRMISNINTLIAELALEKDQVMQALSTETSRTSNLLELNKELTRKLEVQTQRLELLTSQNLSVDSIQKKQVEHRTFESTSTSTYADEGDEVVERVMGWIMKLFPGGGRFSKHV